MKKLGILLIALMLAGNLSAQSQQAKDKIESARIGFITERLGLTPEQAEQFWPLYNEYRQRNQDVSKRYRQFKAGLDPDGPTADESRRLVEMELELKQLRLDLEKEYSRKMLDVISTQQVANLRKAERDFRGILLRRLQQARQQQLRQQRLQNRDQLRDQIRDNYRD